MNRRYWTRRIHVSWHIAMWSLGAVIGVIGSISLFGDGRLSIAWLLAGVLLLGLCSWKRARWILSLALLSGLMIGLWRGSSQRIDPGVYTQLYGSTIELTGTVSEDPDLNNKTQTILQLRNIKQGSRVAPGLIRVITGSNETLKRSDIVTVKGELSEGFGKYAGVMYRAAVVTIERPVPGDVAVGVRDWFANRVRQLIPEPQASLGLGFLLGLRRSLPAELVTALQVAGLTHVIVASGYNLTILVRLGRRLFARVSKYLATLSAATMIVGFMAITGASPSMSRAGLVAGISLAAWYYGRKLHPLVLLPLAAAITLLIQPSYGWNDLGWQLSFASFTGVILLAPLLQRYFFGPKKPGVLRQIFGETFSAQIITAPLLILTFGVVSNVSLVANILILPFVPLAMLLVFLTGALASVPLLGYIISIPAGWLLEYMVSVAGWLADQSWAQTELQLSWVHAAGFYATLGLMMWYLQRRTGLELEEINIVK